jgi:hypothetical protein
VRRQILSFLRELKKEVQRGLRFLLELMLQRILLLLRGQVGRGKSFFISSLGWMQKDFADF